MTLDHWFILVEMDLSGISRADVGHEPGREATKVVLGMLAELDDDAKADVDDFDGLLASYRLMDEVAGDGNELADAVKAVGAPEVVAATRAGGGLPADARTFADGLFALVADWATKESLAWTEELGSALWTLDGFVAFKEVAKYSQDCLRMAIADPKDDEDTSTVTTSSTTTTTLPASTSSTEPWLMVVSDEGVVETVPISVLPGSPRNLVVSDAWVVSWDRPASGGPVDIYEVWVDVGTEDNFFVAYGTYFDVSRHVYGHPGEEFSVFVVASNRFGGGPVAEIRISAPATTTTVASAPPGELASIGLSGDWALIWGAPHTGGAVDSYEVWLEVGNLAWYTATTTNTSFDILRYVTDHPGERFAVTVWAQNSAGRTPVRMSFVAPEAVPTTEVRSDGPTDLVVLDTWAVIWDPPEGGREVSLYEVHLACCLWGRGYTESGTRTDISEYVEGREGQTFTITIRASYQGGGHSGWTEHRFTIPTSTASTTSTTSTSTTSTSTTSTSTTVPVTTTVPATTSSTTASGLAAPRNLTLDTAGGRWVVSWDPPESGSVTYYWFGVIFPTHQNTNWSTQGLEFDLGPWVSLLGETFTFEIRACYSQGAANCSDKVTISHSPDA